VTQQYTLTTTRLSYYQAKCRPRLQLSESPGFPHFRAGKRIQCAAGRAPETPPNDVSERGTLWCVGDKRVRRDIRCRNMLNTLKPRRQP
jgi:hypothetical protein